MRKENVELKLEQSVASLGGCLPAALEDRNGRLELPDHRVGAPEVVGQVGPVGHILRARRERAFEPLDGRTRPAAPKLDVTETGERLCPDNVVSRVLERRRVLVFGGIEIVQAQENLSFEQVRATLEGRLGPRGEEIFADAEPTP